MRAYFFGNMYLSSIQQGIQAAHAVADMFIKYQLSKTCKSDGTCDFRPASIQHQILHEWADRHKTMVLLNAGYGQEIHDLVTFFAESENPFPWAPFRESREALDGALTTVGIVLPEEVYNAAKTLREGPKGDPTELLEKAIVEGVSAFDPWSGYSPTAWEQEMATKLNKYGLAR